MYRKRVLIIIGSLVLCIALFIFVTKLTSCTRYECLDFPEMSQWKVKEVYEQSRDAWRALIQHPQYLVKLQRYTAPNADKAAFYTDVNVMQIEMLYNQARSPYPGALSDTITCQLQYSPQIQTLTSENGIAVTYFTAFVNNRMNYGACTEDQIAYKGFTAMFYCPEAAEWYRVDLLPSYSEVKPDDEYLSLFQRIGCHRPSVNIDKLFP